MASSTITDVVRMGNLPTYLQFAVVFLVAMHVLAFAYWVLRITTDKKKLEMRFKEE